MEGRRVEGRLDLDSSAGLGTALFLHQGAPEARELGPQP